MGKSNGRNSKPRTIGILTAGGDCPGINAAIRGVGKTAIVKYGMKVIGISDGYAGLINKEYRELTESDLSGILTLGGTILGTSREKPYKGNGKKKDESRKPLLIKEHYEQMGLDCLVCIGGNGTMRGTQALYEQGCRVIGVPGTIENDVYGTDAALGTDTALNTALDALDRIRDTASAQQQAFLVELMGEESGYLTLMAGLVGGAEMVCIPEVPFTLEEVACEAAEAYVRGKRHCIITVAEGAKPHAAEIADYLHANQQETGFGVRLSILGHIMRGGPPSAIDRYLGTLFGAEAIKLLAEGASGVMVGMQKNQIVHLPLKEVTANHAHIDARYLHLAKMLAR